MELVEREEAQSGANKPMKGGLKGRKKNMLSEAKPSPMGIRVEPRIDPALKAKAATAAAKKKKAEVRNTIHTVCNREITFKFLFCVRAIIGIGVFCLKAGV